MLHGVDRYAKVHEGNSKVVGVIGWGGGRGEGEGGGSKACVFVFVFGFVSRYRFAPIYAGHD